MKKRLFVAIIAVFIMTLGCSSSSRGNRLSSIPDNWNAYFDNAPISNSCYVGDVYDISVVLYDENDDEVSEDDYDYSSIQWFITKNAGTLSSKNGRTVTLTITTVCKDAGVGVQFAGRASAVGFDVLPVK
jgi:Chromosome segregation ATPases